MKQIMLGMMMALLAISAIIAALSGTAYALRVFNNGPPGISHNGASCTGNCIGGNGGTAPTGVTDGQNGGIAVGTCSFNNGPCLP